MTLVNILRFLFNRRWNIKCVWRPAWWWSSCGYFHHMVVKISNVKK